MATTTTQVSGSIASLLTTELNSLANNSLAIGSAYSSSAGYLMAELQIDVTFGSAPTANTGLSVWFLRAIDGTNYEMGGSSTTPTRWPDAVIPLAALTTQQLITVECKLPPGTFKPLLKNDGSGQAFPSSGSTLKILPTTVQNA
jgi:hypothetical protein